MIEGVALGLTAMVEASQSDYFEAKQVTIPAGEYRIEANNIKWNGMALVSNDEEALNLIQYQKSDGTWDAWHLEHTPNEDGTIATELLFSANPQDGLLIRSEKTLNVIAHFYNTERPGEDLLAFDDSRGGLGTGIEKPQFITREEWGADENLRVRSGQTAIETYFNYSVPEKKWADESMDPILQTKKAEDGRALRWPIEESPKINKFVIHHTGEYIDERRDPKELMRAIYNFHTITRGWGDIGYNYVIDKQGNIYEGRAGGDMAIGAHTAYHNLGSIGISLMGNFQIEQPTEAQLTVLKLFLADLVNRYDVPAVGRSEFLGIISDNITGHRFVARQGHGTSCPGTNLVAKFPEIRRDVLLFARQMSMDPNRVYESEAGPKGMDFLTLNFDELPVAEEQNQVDILTTRLEITNPVIVNTKQAPEPFMRGRSKIYFIEVKNNSGVDWPAEVSFNIINQPEGFNSSAFIAINPIPNGTVGLFEAEALASTTPSGEYEIEIESNIQGVSEGETSQRFLTPIQVSRGAAEALKMSSAKPVNVVKIDSGQKMGTVSPHVFTSSADGDAKINEKTISSPLVKIKLSYFSSKFGAFDSEDVMLLKNRFGETIHRVEPGTEVKFLPRDEEQRFEVNVGGTHIYHIVTPSLETEQTSGVIRIRNYDRGLGQIKYNRFRNKITGRMTGHNAPEFILINELPLEEYLYGLAEEPKTEPLEKKHSIHVLARSYIYVYSGEKRKFGTTWYDLEDSPATSQYYLGYDWEHNHPEQKSIVNETRGTVITYEGQPAIGPYFTQSNGQSSAKWQSQYPWTQAQNLGYDAGLEQLGHGVGLSGNTARAMANSGKSYEEILHYFFRGIAIEAVY